MQVSCRRMQQCPLACDLEDERSSFSLPLLKNTVYSAREVCDHAFWLAYLSGSSSRERIEDLSRDRSRLDPLPSLSTPPSNPEGSSSELGTVFKHCRTISTLGRELGSVVQHHSNTTHRLSVNFASRVRAVKWPWC